LKFCFNSFAFSSFPTFLPTYSLQETIRILAAIGYDAIEIGCCAPHAWPDHLSNDDRREIAKTAKGEGIAISSLLPAIGGGFGCNPCSILAAERQATIDHYKKIIDLAHELDAGMVLYIGGWRAQGMSRSDGWAYSLNCLQQVAAYANAAGIQIAIEPTTADTNLIDSAADARRMMAECEATNVGLMFDSCHVDFEGQSLSSYVDAMSDALIHLHAADTGRTAIGKGKADWDSLLKALLRHQYKGYFTVETGFGDRNVDPVEVARSSLSYLRDRLNVLSDCR
jgi:protein FrlC